MERKVKILFFLKASDVVTRSQIQPDEQAPQPQQHRERPINATAQTESDLLLSIFLVHGASTLKMRNSAQASSH
jgi:hypothetical protein